MAYTLFLSLGQQQSELADRELGRASARDRTVGGSRGHRRRSMPAGIV
jgi:hypothetical protein